MPPTFINTEKYIDLHGTGYLPQVDIIKPEARSAEGYGLLYFIPTVPGCKTSQSLSFKNTGIVGCKVIVELYKNTQDRVFTLTPDKETETMLKAWDLSSKYKLCEPPACCGLHYKLHFVSEPIDHTTIVSLEPQQTATFDVHFQPEAIATYSSSVKLYVVDNPFMNLMYQLYGDVYDSDVLIENLTMDINNDITM